MKNNKNHCAFESSGHAGKKKDIKPVAYGVLGSVVLFVVYIELLTLANSFAHAIEQFLSMWYWIILLVAGFGMQIGLYTYVRSYHSRIHVGGKALAASGGVSTASMILCCLHHFADVLPLIGFAVFSTFLAQYQVTFIILGILSNFIGITMMLNIIQKNSLFEAGSTLSSLFKYDMHILRNLTAIFSLAAFSVLLFSNISSGQINTNSQDLQGSVQLPTLTSDQNSLKIDATPLNFVSGQPAVFQLDFNTHTGALDFDITGVSFLQDSKGNIYYPEKWEGPGAGGHHKAGKLYFSPVDPDAAYMQLIIQNVYDVPQRIFKWELV